MESGHGLRGHRSVRALLLAGALLCASGCETLASQRPTTTVPTPRDEPAWIARDREIDQQAARGGVDLVFLGDSITEGWQGYGRAVWDRYYGNRRPLNLGISADRTEHALWRIQHGNLDGIDPRAIVVMIGTNNTPLNTPSEIADGVLELVRTLRELEPQAHVLLLAIFPREQDPEGVLRRKVAAANAEIRARVDPSVTYLDIGSAFLDASGALSTDVMFDYVHLSPRGYEIWARSIEPVLAQWLGPSAASS